MHTISYAIKYWSKGEVEALFLRHEGYLGAIGAFLLGTEGGISSIIFLIPIENLIYDYENV